MAIETLKINGKDYPVKLGYNALKRFQHKTGKTLADVDSDMGLYEPLLFYSLQMGAELEGQKLDLQLKDMPLVLEEVYWDWIVLFPKFFPDKLEEKMKGVGGQRPKRRN